MTARLPYHIIPILRDRLSYLRRDLENHYRALSREPEVQGYDRLTRANLDALAEILRELEGLA